MRPMTVPASVAPAWHALAAEELRAALATGPDGLAAAEAQARLRTYGPNRLPAPPRRSAWRRFLAQFQNLLIYVLLAAALVTAAIGEWEDALVILGVVVLNAFVGFVQEGKAEDALDAIRELLSPRATVVRGGQRRTIPAEELVPGDVVLLQPGDRVPADLRLLEALGLRCDEAALTGESLPAEKDTAPVAATADLGDRRGMAYSGTLVTSGQGRGVVVATGTATEIGRIGGLLESVRPLDTPLTRKLDGLARQLTVTILALAVLLVLFGTLVRDYALREMFMAAVGIAVAAIPEGLPAIMTIALAVGVRRMARRHAIIRHLPSVETLGSVRIICTDKTGTLTRNEMTVRSVALADGTATVAGTGYAPEGEIALGGTSPDAVRAVALAGLLCNEARLHRQDGRWRLVGDPTEGALLTLALKLGLDPEREAAACPRLATIEFASERQYMASLHAVPGGTRLIVKGAIERVLPMCGVTTAEATFWHRRLEALAGQGQRVLALAAADRPATLTGLDAREPLGGLTLLGLVGMIDPPRPEAVTAIARCRAAGIRVKMITGDHAVTALAIAREVGLAETGLAVTGAELARLDDGALEERALAADVFARVTPEQKLRLVEALQRRGKVVAMTGDGVNDAPALKRADIGVAMGERGTEAAKEAARMVLADDNFASIEAAVEEGRTVYDNLRKSILFILPTNGGECLLLIAAILIGTELPITALQILWVNMITTVALDLALAFEPAEPGTMRRPPRPPDEPLLTRHLLWLAGLVSLLILAAAFGGFLWYRAGGAELELARTVAVNTVVFCELFYLFSCRSLTEPALTRKGLLGSPIVLGAVGAVVLFQLLYTYAPPLQVLFDSRPLAAADWLFVLIAAGLVLPIVDLAESRIRRRSGQD
jgi:magnesium-transporting ATPase (P-type)